MIEFIKLQIKESENWSDATLIVGVLGICETNNVLVYSLNKFPLVFLHKAEYANLDFLRAELFLSTMSLYLDCIDIDTQESETIIIPVTIIKT